jgi:hypothetical protein
MLEKIVDGLIEGHERLIFTQEDERVQSLDTRLRLRPKSAIYPSPEKRLRKRGTSVKLHTGEP